MWTPHAELHGAPCGGQRGIVDKDLHKLIVRQWQEPRAALMYILQGRFVAPLAAVEVAHMLRRVVNPTSQVVSMLTSLSKIDIEVFGPPRGRGCGSRPEATRGAFSHFHDCLGDASRRRRRGRTRSSIGEGRGCNKFAPVLGRDGTKMAPTENVFDHPLDGMS